MRAAMLLCGAWLAGTGLAAAWRFRRQLRPAAGADLGALGIAAAVGMAAVAVAIFVNVVRTPIWHNNAARLAPSVSLAYGYDLYQPVDRGPILNHIYGPVSGIVYLPAALAREPVGALILGGALTALFGLLPVWLVVRAASRGRGPDAVTSRRIGMAAFALVALLLYQQRATRHMIANIHADAPAVGFALLSLLPLIRCGAAPGRLRLALSAFFAVCAVGSKQVELPLLVAVPAWLWAASGRRAALLWSAHVVGLGLAVGAAFAAWFGLSPLWFNTIEVPRHHPWIAFGLGRGLLHLIDHSMVNGLLGVTLALVVALKRAPGASWRAWLGQQPWTLVAALAVASSTTGVLSLAKVGGDINGFHTVYYLAVTCGLLLAGAATSTAESPLPPATARWVLCMLLLLLVVPVAGREIMSLPEAEQGLARRAALFRFVRGHPRQVYAPWDPLTTLLAEGRLYHFDYGVTDRRLAGLPPSPAHYRAQLPEDLRWVVIQDRDPPPAEAERYLRIGAPVVTSLEGHVVRPVGAAW